MGSAVGRFNCFSGGVVSRAVSLGISDYFGRFKRMQLSPKPAIRPVDAECDWQRTWAKYGDMVNSRVLAFLTRRRPATLRLRTFFLREGESVDHAIMPVQSSPAFLSRLGELEHHRQGQTT